MIIYKQGDIFDSQCKWLVNPVNCYGVMGAGLAKEFKRRYPEMDIEYREECRLGAVRIGECYRWVNDKETSKNVMLFPTKKHWLNESKLSEIELGLSYLSDRILSDEWDISSIAFPKLGSGLGGLSWRNVKPMMESELNDVSKKILVEIWE